MAKTNLVPAALALTALAAVIGGLLWTSERDGPGSAQLAQAQTPAASADAVAPGGRAFAAAPRDCVATRTMPGGNNLYVANAPLVDDLGKGFVVSGVVRTAGSCEPVRNARIQIWLNTERGGEGLASNRGSVTTDGDGRYRLETSPVVPQFGQPHVHIAYDDPAYGRLFLRPVLASETDAAIVVDFALAPNPPAS